MESKNYYREFNKIFAEKGLGIFSEALLRLTMADTNNATPFACDKCYFKCSKKSDWERHCIRPKHEVNVQRYENDDKKINTHQIDNDDVIDIDDIE